MKFKIVFSSIIKETLVNLRVDPTRILQIIKITYPIGNYFKTNLITSVDKQVDGDNKVGNILNSIPVDVRIFLKKD